MAAKKSLLDRITDIAFEAEADELQDAIKTLKNIGKRRFPPTKKSKASPTPRKKRTPSPTLAPAATTEEQQ